MGGGKVLRILRARWSVGPSKVSMDGSCAGFAGWNKCSIGCAEDACDGGLLGPEGPAAMVGTRKVRRLENGQEARNGHGKTDPPAWPSMVGPIATACRCFCFGQVGSS